jgi:adenylate kinase family enzyme/GNAT superfamily N-acetyltransferase
MGLTTRKWSFHKEEEWARFLSFFTAYLKECGEKEEDIEGCYDPEYRKLILHLSRRRKSPFVTRELLKDGQTIGFAQYAAFPLEHCKSVLGNIFVLPHYRNDGSGTFLYGEAEKDLLAQGARYIDASIRPEALSFYLRKGFQKTNDLMAENNLPAYRKFLPRPFPFKKILILGSPGAGKSYLTDQLSQRFPYPFVHLDAIYWKPGWEHLSDEEIKAKLASTMAGPSWIIDGNYPSTLEWRYQQADMVFFLDYPSEICIEGEAKRRGQPRDDFPSFLKEGEDPSFIKFIATFPQKGRPFIQEMANKYLHTPFIRFTSREECNQFLSLYPLLKP